MGSTPSCSHPIKDMALLSEVHPGNYVFYGVWTDLDIVVSVYQFILCRFQIEMTIMTKKKLLTNMQWTINNLLKSSRGSVCENANVRVSCSGHSLEFFLSAPWMICPGATPPLNSLKILLFLRTCLTWRISCCILHIWRANSRKCPGKEFPELTSENG